MHSPIIFVPREKPSKNDNTNVHSTAPDRVIILDMGAAESQEEQKPDPSTEKDKKQTVENRRANPEFAVYQYYGQNIQTAKDSWFESNTYGNNSGGMEYTPSRNSFVNLVLTIVMIMLLGTVGFNIFVNLYEPVSILFLKYGTLFLIIGLSLMICLNYALICSKCATVAPCSYFFLGLTVVGMSLVTAGLTVKVSKILILYALIATTLTVFVCVLIACSSFDFTKWTLYVIVAASVFSVLSICVLLGILIANVYFKPLHLALLFIGTLFSVVILIIELQMIIGGKTIQLEEDDYAIAAFMVYTSIVDIFVRILLIGYLFDS